MILAELWGSRLVVQIQCNNRLETVSVIGNYHGTLTKVSMKSIQILPRSYREKYILFPVTRGKYGIVPFFSYNVTRVSRKVNKIFTNIVIYKEWVIFANFKENMPSVDFCQCSIHICRIFQSWFLWIFKLYFSKDFIIIHSIGIGDR